MWLYARRGGNGSRLIRRLVTPERPGLATRDRGRAMCTELHEVLREQDVQRPVEGDAHLLLEARQLREIDCPPQPPGDEARELEAEDVRDTAAAADGGQQADRREREGRLRLCAELGDDVSRDARAFAQGMLRGGRVRLSRGGIRDARAVTTAQTLGRSADCRYSFTTSRPRDRSHGRHSSMGFAEMPAVQTTVRASTSSPLLKTVRDR